LNLNLRTTQNTSVPYIKCDFSNWKNEPWPDLMLFWWLPSNRLRDRENWESHYCTQKQHINAKYKSDSIAHITSVNTFTPNFTTKLTLETSSILACSFRVQSKSHVPVHQPQGFGMGNTCIPVVDSFWYLAKLIQLCKV